METIIGRLVPPSACSSAELRSAYALLLENFEGVTWNDFIRDLEEKEYIALIEAGDPSEHARHIVGFSTMTTLHLRANCGSIRAIFSGDTTIQYHYRRSFELGKCLGRYFLERIAEPNSAELWYVLISKGWKTYRAMEFMFRDFVPRPFSVGPADAAFDVIRAFARAKYPDRYDEHRQILRADAGAQRLRATSPDAEIPEGQLAAQFFAARNPGYLVGDELLCVARVTPENFTPRFERVIDPIRSVRP